MSSKRNLPFKKLDNINKKIGEDTYIEVEDRRCAANQGGKDAARKRGEKK